MKVNISGVGLIPKIGLLAPIYGKDLTRDDVANLLNYSSFRIYVAATGIKITKANIDEVFGITLPTAAPKKKTTKKPVKKTTTPKSTKEPEKKEAPIFNQGIPEYTGELSQYSSYGIGGMPIEQVDEPVVLNEVVEAPAIDEPVKEVPVNEVTSNDTVDVVEEKPTYTGKKKKRH